MNHRLKNNDFSCYFLTSGLNSVLVQYTTYLFNESESLACERSGNSSRKCAFVQHFHFSFLVLQLPHFYRDSLEDPSSIKIESKCNGGVNYM